MTDLANAIRHHVTTLPTCSLTIGEYMNKPAVKAGDEPVFLIRSAPIGKLYSEAIVALLPLMNQAVQTLMEGGQQPVGDALGDKGGAVEDRVRGAIEATVSMQPELKGRAGLFSKMLFSAIARYLSTSAPQEVISAPANNVGPSSAEIATVRNDAVSDFVNWLASSGLVPGLSDELLENVMVAWEELQHD